LPAIELHETPLLQRRKQSVHGRRGQTCTDREVGQAVSFVIFGQRFDDRESTVYGLYAAIARLGVAFPVGFLLDGPAPDQVSLHRDLHSFRSCGGVLAIRSWSSLCVAFL
jgi:hypothetical protein